MYLFKINYRHTFGIKTLKLKYDKKEYSNSYAIGLFNLIVTFLVYLFILTEKKTYICKLYLLKSWNH